jgi:DNA-binding IscR family transcriptional regulator
MSDVLRALEGPIAPMVCASDDPETGITCDRSARCTVNVLWVRIRDAITGTLEGMTLADLVPRVPAEPTDTLTSNQPLIHVDSVPATASVASPATV